jgi:catalase
MNLIFCFTLLACFTISFVNSNQLLQYLNTCGLKNEELTTNHGAPVATKTASMTAGPRGPLLVQDITLFDEISHFDRERIPERVAHAKGGGAFGYFEVTHDITNFTKNVVFNQIGKRTSVVSCSNVN